MSEFRRLSSEGRAEANRLRDQLRRSRLRFDDPDRIELDEFEREEIIEQIDRLDNGHEE